MAAQLQEIPLEKLLNLALGHPGQGVVDFRLLKEFLMQFLVATKTNDFAVAKKFAGHGGEIVAELRPKVKDGVEDIDREAVGTMLILDSQSSDQEDYNNLGVLTKQIKRLNKQNEGLSKRLNEVENSTRRFAPMDSLPSGRELLHKGRQEAMTTAVEGLPGQEELGNEKSEQLKGKEGAMKESLEKEGGDSVRNPAPGAKTNELERIPSTETKENRSTNDSAQGKYFNTTWNNVRVNKRLQAIEDGVDTLFSMLDILTAEHNKLEDKYKKNEEGISMEAFMKLKEKLDSVAENAAGSETGVVESGLAEATESKDFESDITEIKERLQKLESEANVNANIRESLNRVDASKSDLPERDFTDDDISDLKKRLSEIEAKDKDFATVFATKQDLEKLEKGVADSNDRLIKTMDGLMPKGDMEEYVTWPALEHALNVRGYTEQRDNPKQRVIGNGDETAIGNREAPLKIEDIEREKTIIEGKGGRLGHDDDGNSTDSKQEENNLAQKERPVYSEEKPVGDGINVHSKETDGAPPVLKEKADSSQYPSAELREFLRRVSFVAAKYDDLEAKVGGLLEEKSKDDREALRKQIDGLKDAVSSVTQQTENNKSSIDDVRGNMALLMKEGPGDKVKDDLFDGSALDEIRGHLMDLDEREAQTSLALGNLSSNVFNELKGKQYLIDALYKCVEQLQRNKMDIANATSIFDSEAYKKALDTKVSMNDFDEMMVSLDKNLQEVLQRLDKYATEEESLKESLEKLMEDMQGKLDAKTGESIKKYLESRIAQLQKTRDNLVSKAGQDIITNAAGLRRPLNTLFHCISCDRPVNQDGQGAFQSISTNKFPMKKSRGPYTAFNIEKSKEDLQQDTAFYESLNEKDKKLNWDILKDPFSKTRPCGGSHTAYIYSPKKPTKSTTVHRTTGRPDIARYHAVERKREKTIVDLLLGSDGHVYRGRYKMTDLRYDNNNGASKFDRSHLRSRSAEVPRPNFADTRHVTGFFSSPTSKVSTPRTLPPIDKEAFAMKTPASSLAGFRDEKETRNGREASMPIENGKMDQDT